GCSRREQLRAGIVYLLLRFRADRGAGTLCEIGSAAERHQRRGESGRRNRFPGGIQTATRNADRKLVHLPREGSLIGCSGIVGTKRAARVASSSKTSAFAY